MFPDAAHFARRIPARGIDQNALMRRRSSLSQTVGQSAQELGLSCLDRLSEPQIGEKPAPDLAGTVPELRPRSIPSGAFDSRRAGNTHRGRPVARRQAHRRAQGVEIAVDGALGHFQAAGESAGREMPVRV